MIRVLRLLAIALPTGLVLAWVYARTGSVLATGVLVVLPALAVLQVSAMREDLPPRSVVYRSSMASHVIFGSLALLAGMSAFGLQEMGLSPLPGLRDLLWTVVVLAVVLGANVGLHFVTDAMGVESSEILKRLVPRSAEDRRTFAVMSVTAGLGEETVYRSFLFLVLLTAGLPVWGALVVQALAFGMVHAYQGPVGVAATAILGMAFGLSFVLLGTLWPAILAHVAVDWVVGLLLTDYFFGPQEAPTPGAPSAETPPPEPEPTPTDSV